MEIRKENRAFGGGFCIVWGKGYWGIESNTRKLIEDSKEQSGEHR
jgi:hypothetical protein